MEQQQPDKLFRQKLESHQLTAPASAWNKIESGPGKKKSDYRWLMVAATLLLLAVAIAVVTNYQDNTDPSENTLTKKTVTPKQDSPTETRITAVLTPPEVRPTIKRTAKKKLPTAPVKKYTAPEIAEASTATNLLPDNNAVAPVVVTEKIESFTLHDTLNAVQPEVAATGNFKLVLEADEVNKKYLKQYSAADATTAEKKPSTLKRVLNKVESLKTNQDPFGELREKKNEILALNFKKEKQHK